MFGNLWTPERMAQALSGDSVQYAALNVSNTYRSMHMQETSRAPALSEEFRKQAAMEYNAILEIVYGNPKKEV